MLFVWKEPEIDKKKLKNHHQGKGAAPVFH